MDRPTSKAVDSICKLNGWRGLGLIWVDRGEEFGQDLAWTLGTA
jgi:hypothetical protein